MKANLEKRLRSLESAFGQFCPHCAASEAMSDAMSVEELDAHIQALLSGQVASELPDPSPSCLHCQKMAAMSEAEVDARLAWLTDILAQSEKYLAERNAGVAAGLEQ
jgi:uncharacterized small protein (DUF1192 family)